MVQRIATFFPERVNMRVPNMTYDGALGMNPKGPHTIDMQDSGSPLAVASTTNILNVKAMPADGAAFAAADFGSGALPMAVPNRGRWGRKIQFVASAGNTGVLEVVGRDYLGQRMVKRVTMNGATPVTAAGGAALVAWWSIESVTVVSGTGAVNISVGTQNVFGLPYKATALIASLMDGATTTAHTLTAAITTDPATNATGDPRGLISFNTAPDSAHTYQAVLMFDDTNLHGVAQYGG